MLLPALPQGFELMLSSRAAMDPAAMDPDEPPGTNGERMDPTEVRDQQGRLVPPFIMQSRRGKRIQVRNPNYERIKADNGRRQSCALSVHMSTILDGAV